MRWNAASRLARLSDRVATQGGQGVAIEAWAPVFGLPDPRTRQRDAQVAQLIGVAHSELDLLRAQLELTDTPAGSYANYLSRLDTMLSIQTLGGPWEHVQKRVSDDIRAGLRLLPGLIPADPVEFSEEDIDRLRAMSAEIRKGLGERAVSARLGSFLNAQLDLFESALREYFLAGAAVVEVAAARAAGDWLTASVELSDELQREEAQAVRSLWREVKRAGGIALKYGAVAHLVFVETPETFRSFDDLLSLPSTSHPAPPQGQRPTPGTDQQFFIGSAHPGQGPRIEENDGSDDGAAPS